MIIIAAIIFVFGVIVIATAHNYAGLLSGRLIQGIGVGIITIAVPLYLAESVPPSIRGEAIGAFQLLLTAGILMSSWTGLYFTQTGNWRAMFWSALIPGLLLLGGGCFLPESPRWLCVKGHFDKAKNVLMKSRQELQAKNEIIQIQSSIQSLGKSVLLFES